MAKRNPWVAIMVADDKGLGLHLSAAEVELLAQDSAIEACAIIDVYKTQFAATEWRLIDPKKIPIKHDSHT